MMDVDVVSVNEKRQPLGSPENKTVSGNFWYGSEPDTDNGISYLIPMTSPVTNPLP